MKRVWATLVRVSIFGLILAFIAGIAAAAYYASIFPDWTGLPPGAVDAQGKELPRAKTLWDWLDLLLVPLVLAVGSYFLTRSENRYALGLQERREKEAQRLEDQRIQEARRIEDLRIQEARKLEEQRTRETRRIEEQRARDTALQVYLDQMTQLLLHNNLRASKPNDEVRSVARARTLAVLRVLDGVRKATVLQFLFEASLIGGIKSIGDGSGTYDTVVSLYHADLQGAHLVDTMLAGAHLNGANLGGAHLEGANLKCANLYGANLGGAHLDGTSLNDADLTKCKVTREQLAQVASLEGAKLPLI